MDAPLSTKPIRRILAWQAATTVVLALLIGLMAGAHGALSALLGGVVNISAVVVYAVVLGISKDAPAAQKKFAGKYQLPFPLLCDPGLEVHEAWGVWGEKVMYGKKIMGTIRTTVVVGADGKVEQVLGKVKVTGHVASLLDSL